MVTTRTSISNSIKPKAKMPSVCKGKTKMPTKKKRNYRKEYDNYHSKPKAKKQRAQNNTARAKMAKGGKVRKGDGKDVAHKDNNTKNNKLSNLKTQSKSKNRSFARTKNAKRKTTKTKKK